MPSDTKILAVSNVCPHYRIPIFERIAHSYTTKFLFFSEGNERFLNQKNDYKFGNFNGEYLDGFRILPKIKFSPKLIKYLLYDDYDYLLLSIVGRFTVPISFFIAHFIRKKPVVGWLGMWSHPQSFFHTITFPLTKMLYCNLDAILVYGTHSKKYVEDIGINGEKVFCAWNAVDNSAFEKPVEAAEGEKIRSELGIEDKKILLYVGRFSESKGLRYLLEAVNLLKELQNEFVLLLAGNGEQEGELKNIVVRYQLPNVVFTGHIANNEMRILYGISTISVLPSIEWKGNKEPWGLVCNESMIQGCPVIATNIVGAAVGGLIDHNVNGIVVPEKNSPALSVAIKNLLVDEEKRMAFSIHCKEKMKTWTPDFQFSGIQQAFKYVEQKSVKSLQNASR